MTIYQFRPNNKQINVNQQVSIACEITTREHFETDCHRLIPMNTKVIHLKAKAEKIFLADGNRCDYDYVRELLRSRGYGRSWCLMSVWLVEEEDEF